MNMNHFSADERMLVYGAMQPHTDVFCFSTTRKGGYSEGAYASFNCNGYCGDREEAVERNRGLLCGLLPQRPEGLVIPHQTHGTEVCTVDEAFLRLPEADRAEALEGVDALMTRIPGQCLCVSTADCIPVLCYDRRLRAAAAIHAGWRGTVARIVEKTLRRMKEAYGTRSEDVVACIGPGISLEAFEVGDEVYQTFAGAGFPMERIARRESKWHLDLWEANRLQLLEQGVPEAQVSVSGICTYRQNDTFFSARRQGILSGRILSGILLMRHS